MEGARSGLRATADRLGADESRFRALFDAAPIGIGIVGADSHPVRVNRALTQMLGYTEAELCAMSFATFTHPADVAAGVAIFDALRAGLRDRFTTEKRYLRKDGSILFARLVVSLVAWSDDEEPFVLGMIEDLSDVHAAREDVRRTKEALSERVKELTALHGLARAVHESGTSVEELIERVVELVPPAMKHRADATASVRYGDLHRVVGPHSQAQSVLAVEFTTSDGVDGEIAVGYSTAHADEPEGGSFAVEERALIASIADIVRAAIDERMAQAALLRSQGQLRHAQRMDAIGRVTAGVAHDFNNLLLVIAGNCDLMLDGQLEPEVREMMLEVRDAGRRGRDLTRQLLAFSRKSELNPERVEIGAHVRSVAPLLARVAGPTVRIDLEGLRSSSHVRVDRVLLDQILVNLVVNARDAMPRGGRLRIETEDVDVAVADPPLRPGRYVATTVHDDGAGMTRETLARVFEPFFTTKPPGTGTGLGLAVVFGVVQQSGGHIDARSELGVGSSFRFLLPIG